MNFFSQEDLRQFNKFWSLYGTLAQINCPEQKVPPSTSKDQRVCRYCGAQGTGIWKNEAHSFPMFMGNRTLISYDECDRCNQFFSELETDLAAFLGLSRTINQVKGRRGVPKVKSPKTAVVITGDELWYGQQVVNISFEQVADNVTIDLARGQVEIVVHKESYVPLNAYKILVKLVFAVLPPEELKCYPRLLKLVLTSSSDDLLRSCRISKVSFPFGHGPAAPMLWLWKKKDPQTSHPTHEVLLFWQNFVFQYTLPFHEDDIAYFRNKPMTSLVVPPFLIGSPARTITTQQTISMGASEPVKGELEVVRLSYDPSIPLSAYDPQTQRLVDKELVAGDVKGIIIKKDSDFRLPIIEE